MAPNGRVSASDQLFYSNKIPVTEGDVISADHTFRFVTAFNLVGQAVEASGATNANGYTVPANITDIVLTTYSGASGIDLRTYTTTGYVLKGSDRDYYRDSGDMSDGDTFTLPFQNINKRTVEIFSGEITTFSKLEIGKGYYVEIDDTNITLHKGSTVDAPIPHGLTIQNDIQVKITANTDGKTNPRNFFQATIKITSNGESFETTDAYWLQSLANSPFVRSVGSVLHGCSFSFQSLDVNKNIYAYGDSYFSWYPERWVYYLAIDGYAANVFTNAFAGQGTPTAITALRNTIKLGSPKFILWCLGMNDGSDTDTPSPQWKSGIDIVASICKEYGITPIFATIPTVPTVNHEKKNQWVRNSGYRYVDFAKAVGPRRLVYGIPECSQMECIQRKQVQKLFTIDF